MLTCLNNATIGAASFEGFLEAAHIAGFAAIEVGVGSLEEYVAKHSLMTLADELRRKGLVFGSGGLPLDWRAPDETFRHDLEALPSRLKLCRQLSLMRLCTWIPPRWDKPYVEVFAFARERFRAVAETLAPYEISLGLEFVAPQGGFLDKRYKFITTLAEVLHLIEAIGCDNVGLLLDSYHLFVGETPMAELAALAASRIVQFHINDAYPAVPREELQDLKRALPGEGAIPLVPMLLALKSTGYNWTISVESFNEEVKALGPVEAAKRTKASLDAILSVL